MPDKAWKAFERRVARLFGTTRLGPVGREGPDVVTQLFAVECREHKTVSYSEIEAWVAEVRRDSPAHLVPVLAVRRRRGRGRALAPTLFVLDEQAWLDLHGPAPAPVEVVDFAAAAEAVNG